MSSTQITEKLMQVNIGAWQAYLWLDEDSVTLIDTGAPGSAPAIAAALRRVGRRPQDLDRVVLTHFHDDHAGSARDVAAWGAVEVVAHHADADIIRGDRTGPAPNFTEWERELHQQLAADLQPAPAAPVHSEVADDDELPFGGGAHVLSVPGHTDGSIAIHLPRDGVLFTGDTIANVGTVMLGTFNQDRAQTVTSFKRLAELNVETACFGHGEPIISAAAARIRATAATLTG